MVFCSISSCGALRFASSGLHFSFWASYLAFGALILAFWALRGVSCGSFWPFGPSGGVSFTTSGLRSWAPPHKLPKMVRFPKLPYKEFISAVAGSIFQFLALWTLIFFILALRAFVSCSFAFLGFILAFGLLWGVHFATLGLQGGYPLALCGLLGLQGGYPSQLRASARGPPPHKLPKMVRCPKVPYKEFISAVAESIFQFLGLWALIFFILALYALISFYFGLLGLHFSFSATILALGCPFCHFGPSGGYPLALCGFFGFQGG